MKRSTWETIVWAARYFAAAAALLISLKSKCFGQAPPSPTTVGSSLDRSSDAASPSPRWFRTQLALSYVLPVGMLAWGAAANSLALGLTGTAVALLLPPVVHALYGDRYGVAPTLAATLASMLVVGVLGVALILPATAGAYDRAHNIDEPSFEYALRLMGAGAAVGCLAWAAIDVAFFAYAPAAPSPSGLSAYAVPISGTYRGHSDSHVDGLLFGLAESF